MRTINIALLVAFFSTSLSAQDEDKWTNLFNGEDTSGWTNPYDWGDISVEDEEIHLKASKKFFLVTQRDDYKDFIFEGEILLPEGKANSGFMFRCHVTPNKVFGYQAEV